MSKRRAHGRTRKSRRPSPRGRSGALFGVGCVLVYGYAAIVLGSSVSFDPAPLDDVSLLREFGGKPLSDVFGYDHFGHLRPVKNLLFWVVAHEVIGLAAMRALVLGVFLAGAAAFQVLATRVLESRVWGLAAVACWALNPTIASVVSWLSAANYAICLLAVLLYLSCSQRALAEDAGPRSVHWSVGAALALLLALSSHQLAVLCPLLVLGYVWALGRARPAWKAVRPWVLGSALAFVPLVSLYLVFEAPEQAYRFAVHPDWQLMLSSMRYLLLDLRLWLWQPGAFGVLFVDQPADHLLASTVCWLIVVAALAVWWRWGRRDAVVGFGLLWPAVFLLPMTNLVPLGSTPVAPHYLYLPSVGLALVLARVTQRAAGVLQAGEGAGRARWAALPLLALVVAWQPAYWRTRALWGDPVELYATTVANHPDNVEARVNLSALYLEQDRYAEADRLLEQSLAFAPEEPALMRNRFQLLYETNRNQEALAYLDAHPSLDDHAQLLRRAMLLRRLGRHDEAVEAFEHAFNQARQPEQRATSGYWLATALTQVGETARARRLIDELLDEFPDHRELRLAQRLLAGATGDTGDGPL